MSLRGNAIICIFILLILIIGCMFSTYVIDTYHEHWFAGLVIFVIFMLCLASILWCWLCEEVHKFITSFYQPDETHLPRHDTHIHVYTPDCNCIYSIFDDEPESYSIFDDSNEQESYSIFDDDSILTLSTLPLDHKRRQEWIDKITKQHTEWEKEILDDLINIKLRDDICPICMEKIIDPIVCANKHACCRICIEQWRRGTNLVSCPICKENRLWDLNDLYAPIPVLYQWK